MPNRRRTSRGLRRRVEAVDARSRRSSGARSVVSIWIVVVLPAPFGPRNAKISPARDIERDAVDGRHLTVGLDEVADLNHAIGSCSVGGVRSKRRRSSTIEVLASLPGTSRLSEHRPPVRSVPPWQAVRVFARNWRFILLILFNGPSLSQQSHRSPLTRAAKQQRISQGRALDDLARPLVVPRKLHANCEVCAALDQ